MTGTILLVLRIFLAAALYGFLLLALGLMWRELRRANRQTHAAHPPQLTLSHQAEGSSALYHFGEPEVTVGRDPTCQLCLDDKTISARHARLSYHHGQWWVEDLHSTNGTYLNLETVSGPIVVATSDLVRFGGLEFELFVGDRGPGESDLSDEM